MAFIISCDCGVTVRGQTEDELVQNGQEHAKEAHNMTVTREQLLALADPA